MISSLLTIFDASGIFKVAETVAKIVLSRKVAFLPNCIL